MCGHPVTITVKEFVDQFKTRILSNVFVNPVWYGYVNNQYIVGSLREAKFGVVSINDMIDVIEVNARDCSERCRNFLEFALIIFNY